MTHESHNMFTLGYKNVWNHIRFFSLYYDTINKGQKFLTKWFEKNFLQPTYKNDKYS
jgi:hypothetical protein